MSESSWHMDDTAPDAPAPTTGQLALVNLHFMRSALQRRWRVWTAVGCTGLLLGLTYAVLVPAMTVGTVTLMLVHRPGSNADAEMATDVSLVRTRTVAERVVDELDLRMSPEAFLQTVTVQPLSTQVLVLDVTAPDRAAAEARARALSQVYLDFRGEQVVAASRGLIDGNTRRIAALEERETALTRQYDALRGTSEEGNSRANDALTERSRVTAEINTLQQQVQESSLATESINAASRVLDPATSVSQSTRRQLVLSMASGLVGGTAVGVGFVLLTAVTSDRLRRRGEVALALGTPVRVSVKGLGGSARGLRPSRRRPGSHDVQILAHALASVSSPAGTSGPQGLQKALSPQPHVPQTTPVRLVLGSIENVEAGHVVVAGLAAELANRQQSLFIVDLTRAGGLETTVGRALHQEHPPGSSGSPVVFRPRGLPAVARGPHGMPAGATTDLPPHDPHRRAWDSADVVVVLSEVDPALGVDHLRSWGEKVVLLVTAGRSSAERLRSTGELVRSAGLELCFAMLVGGDPRDESLGLPDKAGLERGDDRGGAS